VSARLTQDSVLRPVPETERLADQHADTGLGEARLQLVELVKLVAHGVDEVVLSGG